MTDREEGRAGEGFEHVDPLPGQEPGKRQGKPNGHDSTTWRERLDLRRASDLEGKEIKPREWVVPQWVPRRHLTGLYGPGSAGKTTLASGAHLGLPD